MGVSAEAKKIIAEIEAWCEDGTYIFRGTNKTHSDNPKGDGISSSLYREYDKEVGFNKYYLPIDIEKNTLEKARKHFPGGTSNIEILTDIRHYGGKTSLIDFTTNLYVALFFACYGELEGKGGELVMLNSAGFLIKEDVDLGNREAITIIKPSHTQSSRARAIAQHSIFVYAPQGYIEESDCKAYRIKNNQKQEILDYLKKFHGIHTDSIYNDLLGFIDNEKEQHKSADLHFYKGNKNIAAGKYGDAMESYSAAIELKPDYADAYNNRGIVWSRLKEYKKAIEDISTAIKFDPDIAEPYSNRGTAWFELREYQKAIDDSSRAIKLKPDLADAYYNRGAAWFMLQEYQKSIDDLARAIGFKHDFVNAYYNRGVVWSRLKEYKKAIEDLSRAIELKPDYADAYYSRGVARHESHEDRKAIEDFNRATELNPDFAEAYYNRGAVWFELQECSKAIKDCAKAKSLDHNFTVGADKIIQACQDNLKFNNE